MHKHTQADGLCSAGQQTALFMQAKNTSVCQVLGSQPLLQEKSLSNTDYSVMDKILNQQGNMAFCHSS